MRSKFNIETLSTKERELHDEWHVEQKQQYELLLKRCGFNQTRMAKILGVNRNTLHTILKKYHIDHKAGVCIKTYEAKW